MLMIIDEEIREKIDRRRKMIEKVKQIIIDKLNFDLEYNEISEDGPLFIMGLGLDSVDALELVVGIEKETGVIITDEDLDALLTINTIVDFIFEHLPKDTHDEKF